jgi:hypothetical protein
LGIDLAGVVTKAKLADAFALALTRTNQAVIKLGPEGAKKSLFKKEE